MVKVPVAGRVKTRLAKGIGAVRATAFYRAATTALVARLASDPRWQTLLAITPDVGVGWRGWPDECGRVAQGQGDLGQRMQRLMDNLPPGPVVIVGSDVPAVRAADIMDAFTALRGADAVLGPCPDGGYWLVGLRRRPRVPRAFDRVRWSSPDTMADTLARLDGLTVRRVATLPDIDEAEDFRRSGGTAGRRVPCL